MERQIIDLIKEVLSQNEKDALNTYLNHRFYGWKGPLKEAVDNGEGDKAILYLTRLKYGVYT